MIQIGLLNSNRCPYLHSHPFHPPLDLSRLWAVDTDEMEKKTDLAEGSEEGSTPAAAATRPPSQPLTESDRLQLKAQMLKLQAEKLRLEAEREQIKMEREAMLKKQVCSESKVYHINVSIYIENYFCSPSSLPLLL